MLFFIGGGGHASVALDIARSLQLEVAGYYDLSPTTLGIPYLGVTPIFHPDQEYFCAIGDNETRQRIVSSAPSATKWKTLIHPSATIAFSSSIKEGSLIGMSAVVGSEAVIGSHVIINTSATIDHHCVIKEYSHIAPGVHLCGHVSVGSQTLIGVGSQVIPDVVIQDRVVVGAGTTILTNISKGRKVMGVVKRSKVKWLATKPVNWSSLQRILQPSIDSNHFSNGGPAVVQLEKRLYDIFSLKGSDKVVIAINNGTAALHALVSGIALHHGKSHRFATQAFTFPSSIQGSLGNSLIVDIDEEGGLDLTSLDPNQVDGLIITNCFGHVVNVSKYEKWCNEHDKFLIFDNAATGASYYQDKHITTYGVGCIVSLHHTKPLGFGEGGAIVVDSMYEKSIRQIINFGYDVPKGDMVCHREGSNYKMADPAAAFILSYLENFREIEKRHITLYEEMKERLDVTLFPNATSSTPMASCFPVLLSHEIPLERVKALSQKYRIDLRKYYKPLSLTPMAVRLWEHILCFPLHVEITSQDIETYQEILQELSL